MRSVPFIFILSCLFNTLSAQYVYTIKADSVKLTHCDSSELIIENHSQNIPGFLFNTGNGRTVFKKAVQKINDSTYLIGADTLKVQPPQNSWSIFGNSGTTPTTNFIGTRDSVALTFKVNNQQAGKISPDGKSNFWGYQAGNVNTGNFNTGLGFKALKANTTGIYNTAVGWRALMANTTGIENTAVGTDALVANTTGGSNTAVGYATLYVNTTGSGNTTLGYSGLMITTGNDNTALGYISLSSNRTGNSNTAVGSKSLGDFDHGVGNTAVGFLSCGTSYWGNYYTAIGDSALLQVLGDSNSAIGHSAGLTTTFGTNNTYLGTYTGIGITTGGHNTIVGSNVTGLSPTLNDNIIIADGKGNRRINVDSLGNVMFNTTSPVAKNTFTGTGNFSDTLTATTIGNTDSSNRVASTAWVKRQGYAIGGGAFNGILNSSLAVNGSISAQRLRLSQTGWPDYVFDSSYRLPNLKETEQYIQQNGHLPGIPSAKEVESKGVDVGDHQAVLLKKIEEITLYMIEQNKKLEAQAKELSTLRQEMMELKKMIPNRSLK